MRARSTTRLDQKGWTLVELMLVVALIGIITPAMTFLFLKLSQGMAADEMHNQLLALNEQTQLRLHERLGLTRHMFQGNSSGASFTAAVTTGMAATTKTAYPILAGTKLSTTQPITASGSFSPVTAVKANFGNSILFGAYDLPQTIGNKGYVAPVTVKGASVTFGSPAGVPATIVVDIYRFYYYYLTSANTKPLRGAPSYRLVEWQSAQFADWNDINGIQDGTLQAAVIQWIATTGNISAGYAVTAAWDPSQSDITQAFYVLTNAGVANLATTISIPEGQVTSLTRVTSGILSTGFMYGVSGNSATWTSAPAVVPQFGVTTAAFPGGFEVGISGSAAGEQILTRLLLVAQGATPKITYNDSSMVHNVRDVW